MNKRDADGRSCKRAAIFMRHSGHADIPSPLAWSGDRLTEMTAPSTAFSRLRKARRFRFRNGTVQRNKDRRMAQTSDDDMDFYGAARED
ncbi:hypothetical protein [Paracoccus homiensis]|uniref:hypothetical protein n=1 Tax=Paracoccus homiensis TaxID=364199 RepID=UPI001587A537|nr:hypothetical protein [Paracoccus homiensis]